MELYRGGLGANRNAGGLSLLPKLKYEHNYLLDFIFQDEGRLGRPGNANFVLIMKCMDSYMYTICMHRY